MKIKHWLMSSYMLVMLLPVAAILILYLLVSQYDQRQDIREYFETSNRIAAIEEVLQEPALYQIQSRKQYASLKTLVNDSTKIELYRSDGITVYSSDESGLPIGLDRIPTDKLYAHLYELRKNNRTYTLKKPVLAKGKMVGIYQITLARDEWVAGVEKRTIWLSIVFAAFFLMVYLCVVWLLERKLNQPLVRLMNRMSAFAENRHVPAGEPHSRDEIGELIAHFESMRTKIEQANQAVAAEQKEKEYLVAALAHDLKTPLTSIRAYAEALSHPEQLSASERREYRGILFEKIDTMKYMLGDLTTYAALRASVQDMEVTNVDGEEFFEMLFSSYEELCQRKGVRLHTQIQVPVDLLVNTRHLMRVADNLMNNALRYTAGGSSIWLSAMTPEVPLPQWVFAPFRTEVEELRPEGVLLIVQNEGEAIAQDLLPRIFDPFFQIDAARTKAGASSFGLGLSIAKMIMDKHGGTIHVWSLEPYGTTFVCLLPIEQRG